MSTSNLTLAELRALVRDLLMDAAPGAVWSDAQLDAAIHQALQEYTRASFQDRSPVPPRAALAEITPADGARELDLSALDPPLVELERVWFPYDAAVDADPAWVRCELWWNEGRPLLYLLDASGDGVSPARLFYRALHALKDLDGAGATTFSAGHESLLAQGAAGYACLMRSADLNETESKMTASTPNYGALAAMWLEYFRGAFAPRRRVRCVPFSVGNDAGGETPGYYDPSRLEWVER